MTTDRKTLIVGLGEVGRAMYEVLKDRYDTFTIDLPGVSTPRDIQEAGLAAVEVLHICVRYSDKFQSTVQSYMKQYKPKLVNICTTVPVGTSRSVYARACHSTTRGLHPNIASGLMQFKKHIGGPDAHELAFYFEEAGIDCMTHEKAEATELLHLLNNIHYGINLMFADEASALCRQFGVDYFDYMKYTETNNAGFEAIGHGTKVRTIATPPNGRIGGHCVVAAAKMISGQGAVTPMVEMLATYNDKERK